MRAVESASFAIAAKLGNPEFACPISRISDIESKGVLPNIFRIFSLSAIYGTDFQELCTFYGIDWDALPSARECVRVPNTHLFNATRSARKILIPTAFDPSFDLRRTISVVRMIQKWGQVPLAFLPKLTDPRYTYAFVGTQDFTMYPLVLPGSFLQVDRGRRHVSKDGWRSEYERPIYFIQTREEFFCTWCKIDEYGRLLIQPHPLSPATPRVFRFPQEAEIIGQVVGIAMRLDEPLKREEFVSAKKGKMTTRVN